jgi:hypothetical protein
VRQPWLDEEPWGRIVAAAAPCKPDDTAREAFNEYLYGCQRFKEIDLQSVEDARTFWKGVASGTRDLANRLIRMRSYSRPWVELLVWTDEDQTAWRTRSRRPARSQQAAGNRRPHRAAAVGHRRRAMAAPDCGLSAAVYPCRHPYGLDPAMVTLTACATAALFGGSWLVCRPAS